MPLHFAVFGGIVENVDFLLKRKARVDVADVRGYTVLHLSTDEYDGDNYAILSLLPEQLRVCGRVLDAQDQCGRTALMHASGKHAPGFDRTGKDINGNIAGIAIVKLLDPEASVTITDFYGQNALHHYYGRRADHIFNDYIYDGTSAGIQGMLIREITFSRVGLLLLTHIIMLSFRI